MSVSNDNKACFRGAIRRILIVILCLFLFAAFLIWRVDTPRAERFRMAVIDQVMLKVEWALVPVTRLSGMISEFQSYTRIYEQNQELRLELQRMKAWRETAIQLERENAHLLALNNVKLSPEMTFMTSAVLADAGSPFRQSVLINIGRRDGVKDGWAAMDGLGIVGRVSGVGENTSRVLFLTDISSRIPVEIAPSGQRAILAGDNSPLPLLEFVENVSQVRAGDRIRTTGDGGVLPPNLLAGTVFLGNDGRLRVKLSANYERLEFLRVIRFRPHTPIAGPGGLVGPILPTGPVPDTTR
ncbi:MAG: rod shape-determining protein MreC [Rhodobacteraceae bacterium]|nr:rod shape-determining protein MreC [Paracoccaceae bacterium]